MAAISIVLKAVDQYSSAITGLNQGFELVGKAISGIAAIASATWEAVKAGAEYAFAGIQKAVELAVKGGNFSEMRRQFQIVADSFDVDSERILKDLDSITLNMISATDSIKLAGKGVAAGFNEADLETIFTFVKRRTELTGEDFNQMAETIIASLAKGRFTTLKEMGLMIEKGASLSSALDTIKQSTLAYGDAGFNTADKINALTNQQDKLLIKIGGAINSSLAWQKVLTELTDAAVDFVNSFDSNAITEFFDAIGALFVAMGKTIERTIGKSEFLTAITIIVDHIKKEYGRLEDFLISGLKKIGDAVVKITELNPFAMYGYGKEVTDDLRKGLDEFWNDFENERVIAAKESSQAIFDAQVDSMMKSAEAQLSAFNEGSKRMVESAQQATSKYKDIWADAFDEIEQSSIFFTDSANNLVDDFSKEVDDIFKELDGLDAGLTDSPNQKIIDQQSSAGQNTVTDTLSQANWPAEFQALGDFMFRWVLSVAAGSPIPMAVTTTP